MVQTFNEFKVTLLNGEIETKEQTERGTVRISQETADINNYYVNSKLLYYELAEVQPEIKPKEEPKKKAGRPKKQ